MFFNWAWRFQYSTSARHCAKIAVFKKEICTKLICFRLNRMILCAYDMFPRTNWFFYAARIKRNLGKTEKNRKTRKRKEENPSFLNISENYVLHLWHLWQTKGVCSEIMLLRLNFLILFCDICDICDTIQPTFMTKPDPLRKNINFVFLAPYLL